MIKTSMNIIFFGTPNEVVPVLEALNKQFDIVAVVTTPDQKSGRKQLLTPSPVKAFAQTKQIPVITPQQFTDEIKKQLEDGQPDLFVVAAYGKIIPNSILDLPKYGAINIHPSLLPKYRGPTPIQSALLNGDSQTGISFMKLDEQMDHGPILHQIPFVIERTDSFGWLMQSMFAQAAQVLPHVIEKYVSDKYTLQPQDDNKATYTKRITKQDGYIDLTELETLSPMEIEKRKIEIARKIHAYYPWPSVWTKTVITKKNDVTISSNKPQEKVIKFLPSSVITNEEKQSHPKHFAIQIEGKNPMTLNDFLNGYPEMRGLMEQLFGDKN